MTATGSTIAVLFKQIAVFSAFIRTNFPLLYDQFPAFPNSQVKKTIEIQLELLLLEGNPHDDCIARINGLTESHKDVNKADVWESDGTFIR